MTGKGAACALRPVDLRRFHPHSGRQQGITRGRLSTSCTCTCTRPIRCSKARFRIARLAELAKADKQAALALTDTDNMFGALEFSEKLAGAGIQPIVGCALADRFRRHRPRRRATPARRRRARIVLLAAREAGYRSLMRLTSRAFLDTPPNEPPQLKLAWLEGETDGLIALTGGPGGPLDRAIAAGQSHLAATRLDALHRLFGDRLYVELQRHGTRAASARPSRC